MSFNSEVVTVEKANELLLQTFGKNQHEKPFYRITQADEKEVLVDHMGTHHINNKYEYLDPRVYVLEVFTDARENREIPRDFSYEPIFAFYGPDGEPQPLVWKAIKFIVDILEKGKKKTFDDYVKEEEQKKKHSIDAIMAEFENAAAKSDNPDLITGETVAGFRSKIE
jgi:hypothetical protein